jgi:hypothetical protein
MNRPSQILFRIALWAFTAILVVQAAWLLSVELVRPHIPYFPVDRSSALAAQSKSVGAGIAAAVGLVRGDLWTDESMTLAGGQIAELFGGRATDEPGVTERIEIAALHAARLSPHDSRAWLLLASAALRLGRPDRDVADDLKMAYYTGPDEAALMPLRIRIATRLNIGGNDELQDLVAQDLDAMVLRHPELKADIAAAYTQASPSGKRLIEATLAKLDPALLRAIRGAGAVK